MLDPNLVPPAPGLFVRQQFEARQLPESVWDAFIPEVAIWRRQLEDVVLSSQKTPDELGASAEMHSHLDGKSQVELVQEKIASLKARVNSMAEHGDSASAASVLRETLPLWEAWATDLQP